MFYRKFVAKVSLLHVFLSVVIKAFFEMIGFFSMKIETKLTEEIPYRSFHKKKAISLSQDDEMAFAILYGSNLFHKKSLLPAT